MKMSKSISVDIEQLADIRRWQRVNGVKGLSVAYSILIKRGLEFNVEKQRPPLPKKSCIRKKGGGVAYHQKNDVHEVVINAKN